MDQGWQQPHAVQGFVPPAQTFDWLAVSFWLPAEAAKGQQQVAVYLHSRRMLDT